ncbi:unnamed protein product, partial [Owenia fusiformis]
TSSAPPLYGTELLPACLPVIFATTMPPVYSCRSILYSSVVVGQYCTDHLLPKYVHVSLRDYLFVLSHILSAFFVIIQFCDKYADLLFVLLLVGFTRWHL